MANFPVFTSYAQADRERHLERFVAEFRKQLRGLLGLPDETSVVFFDRDGVKAGDKWSETITDAVRTAEVLVCLISPTYLGREWCGRELEIFARRSDQLAAGTPGRFVFPIWWQMPVAPRPLPSRLGQFHYRDAQFPARYEALGVQGLARKSLWKQFRQMADRLAELVAETLATAYRLPPGEAVADIVAVANAFDEQQPYDVRLVTLATGGDAWRPTSTDTSVADAAARSARHLQIFVRYAETGPGVAAGLNKAQTEQQVVFVVADAATLPDATGQAINGLNLPNLALLLVDVGVPTVGVESWLGAMPIGAFSRAKAAGLVRVAGPGALDAEMQRLIDEARRRLRASDPTARAEDPALAARAMNEQGIAVDVQPNLAGPGSRVQS